RDLVDRGALRVEVEEGVHVGAAVLAEEEELPLHREGPEPLPGRLVRLPRLVGGPGPARRHAVEHRHGEVHDAPPRRERPRAADRVGHPRPPQSRRIESMRSEADFTAAAVDFAPVSTSCCIVPSALMISTYLTDLKGTRATSIIGWKARPTGSVRSSGRCIARTFAGNFPWIFQTVTPDCSSERNLRSSHASFTCLLVRVMQSESVPPPTATRTLRT